MVGQIKMPMSAAGEKARWLREHMAPLPEDLSFNP